MDESKEPLQVDNATSYIYMDRNLFIAAEAGDMNLFNMYRGDLCCLVDGMQNTALHIYCRTGGAGRRVVKTKFSHNFVEELVAKSPSLLLQRNAKGEVPLHVAATHRKVEMVQFIIKHTKEQEHNEDPEKGPKLEASSRRMMEMLLTMKDEEENTPLHKAAESGSAELVRLLMKELEAEFSFSTNKRGETPLYMAAKRGDHDLVAVILYNCNSILSMDYGGPDGTTALHAAVMSGDSTTVASLINKKKDLIGQMDNKGRTPLHYAAHLGQRLAIVLLLLEGDASSAYVRDKDRGSTALHMAAWQGDILAVEFIIKYCPGCCAIVDKNGWNFLHFAFVTLREYFELESMKRILNADLLHQKDINGITPLHVFRLGPSYPRIVYDGYDEASKLFRRYDITITSYIDEENKKRQQIWESLKEISTNVLVAGKHVEDSFFENKVKAEDEDEKKKNQEFIDKVREAHLVVAALIATVTFAAAFTIPGGYNQENGTAIMSRVLTFKIFLISNTFAFVSSLLAIFLHFLLTYFQLHTKGVAFQIKCIVAADGLTILAILGMVIAFSTGSYAVLQSSSHFAITICTLTLVSIPGLPLSLCCLGYKFLEYSLPKFIQDPTLQ